MSRYKSNNQKSILAPHHGWLIWNLWASLERFSTTKLCWKSMSRVKMVPNKRKSKTKTTTRFSFHGIFRSIALHRAYAFAWECLLYWASIEQFWWWPLDSFLVQRVHRDWNCSQSAIDWHFVFTFSLFNFPFSYSHSICLLHFILWRFEIVR